MSIRHFVFDVGRVLIEWDMEIPFRDLIPDAAERQWFLTNVCTPAWNVEQDRGRGWQEAEDVLVAQFPRQEGRIRAFRPNWHRTNPGEIVATVDLMRRLISLGHDVTLLTNFAADTFAEAQGRFAFLKETRGATVSGEVGRIKPEREIYEIHARRFGLDPAATLFTDDSQKNVAGAIAAGWNGLLFTGAAKLQSDLRDLGIAL